MDDNVIFSGFNSREVNNYNTGGIYPLAEGNNYKECNTCENKQEVLKEIDENFSIIDNIDKLIEWQNKIITKSPEDIKKQLYKELLKSINKWNITFNITNLDTQFALLTLLGISSEEKNKIYQNEISIFFSLILNFQKTLSINIDILWDELKKDTLINTIKLMKNMWFTDFNMYIINELDKSMIIKKISISWDLSISKIDNWESQIENFSINIRNILKWNNTKVSKNFSYNYSNVPVPGIGEDIATWLDFKREWLKIIFWFDHIHKAVDVKTVPIIENFINTIENKFYLYLSNMDDLTWLLRRDKFIEKVWKKEKWSFIIFDIDNFKSINDIYWHNIWDLVIKQIASILTKNIKVNKDTICRWWWEEFVLFLDNIQEEKQVQEVFSRIQSDLKKFDIPELKWRKITLSAWAHITDDIKNNNIIEIIWDADKKLYTSKETGKDKITI